MKENNTGYTGRTYLIDDFSTFVVLRSFFIVSWFVVHRRWSLVAGRSSARSSIFTHGSSFLMRSCILVFFCWSVALLYRWWPSKIRALLRNLSFTLAPPYNSFVTVKKVFRFYIFLLLCFSTVPGNWSSWGAWSPCSETCGNGTSTRTRACDNPPPAYGGADCVGAGTMTKDCLEQLCPG